MIDEEKIILMTRLATYEEKKGRKMRKYNEVYCSDYVLIHLLVTVLAVTVAFGIVFGLYVFNDFEAFMQSVYKMDVISYALNILRIYLYVLAGYAAFTFLFAVIKYHLARKSLNGYYQNLKKLNAYYKEHGN